MVQVLESVEDAAKFNQKIQEIQNDNNWNKEDFSYAVSKVDNIVDQIDQIIVDRQSELERLKKEAERIRSDVGESTLTDLKRKTIHGESDNYGAYIFELYKVEHRRRELHKKISEWKSAQETLESIKASKLNGISTNYKEKYVSGLLAENMAEAVDIYSERQIGSEIQTLKLEVLNILKDVCYHADVDPGDVGVDRLITGSRDLSSNGNGSNGDIGAEQVPEGSGGSSNVNQFKEEGTYELKRKDDENTTKILDQMVQDIGEEELDDMSIAELSKHTDMTEQGLRNKIRTMHNRYEDFDKEVFL